MPSLDFHLAQHVQTPPLSVQPELAWQSWDRQLIRELVSIETVTTPPHWHASKLRTVCHCRLQLPDTVKDDRPRGVERAVVPHYIHASQPVFFLGMWVGPLLIPPVSRVISGLLSERKLFFRGTKPRRTTTYGAGTGISCQKVRAEPFSRFFWFSFVCGFDRVRDGS